MKGVVDSLKPEYEGQVHFRLVDLSNEQGRKFAQFHQVGSVTLMFFADGQRISTLQGQQTPDFLRRAFNRAFGL